MQSIRLFAHEATRTAARQNLAVDEFNAGILTQRLGILYHGLNGVLFGVENVVTIWLGALLVLDPGGGLLGRHAVRVRVLQDAVRSAHRRAIEKRSTCACSACTPSASPTSR